jgi:enoyl-CoA hydratase/carnithine racemase
MSVVLTERRGAVLTIRLNNPPFNFLTAQVMGDLEEILAALRHDRGIRTVVLGSAVPGVFIGHYDIDEILAGAEKVGMPVSPALAPIPLRALSPLVRVPGVGKLLERTPAGGIVALLRFHDVVRRIRDSDKVFVAAIDGPALGGGFELALACDIRIIGDGPYDIGLMEIAFGLLPGGGGSQMLTRMLGAGRTVEMLLEGRLCTPAEALEAGLVQHVVAPGEAAARAHETAARLARRSPIAVRAIKQAVYDGGSARLQRGMAMERARFLALASRQQTLTALQEYRNQLREDQNAGQRVSDFARKRLPAWQAGMAAQFHE